MTFLKYHIYFTNIGGRNKERERKKHRYHQDQGLPFLCTTSRNSQASWHTVVWPSEQTVPCPQPPWDLQALFANVQRKIKFSCFCPCKLGGKKKKATPHTNRKTFSNSSTVIASCSWPRTLPSIPEIIKCNKGFHPLISLFASQIVVLKLKTGL